MHKVILVGYSGHAYVVADILHHQQVDILGYVEKAEKNNNPYHLTYLGDENAESVQAMFRLNPVVIAIGDNTIRQQIFLDIEKHTPLFYNAIHPATIISKHITIGKSVMIMGGAVINPLAQIGNGVIINTSAVVEHECFVADFAHVAPGAVLAGNVKVGKRSFIGANAVVKQGVVIGDNVIVGAGAVVLKNIPDNTVVFGNPAKKLRWIKPLSS
jgi:sugar O-acyltransferase (sialic acid O-acetyltransferase NeuD family)